MFKPSGLEIRYRMNGSPTRVVTYSPWRLRGLATFVVAFLGLAAYFSSQPRDLLAGWDPVTLLARSEQSLEEAAQAPIRSPLQPLVASPSGATPVKNTTEMRPAAAPATTLATKQAAQPEASSPVPAVPTAAETMSPAAASLLQGPTAPVAMANSGNEPTQETADPVPAAQPETSQAEKPSEETRPLALGEHKLIAIDFKRIGTEGSDINAAFGLRNTSGKRISGTVSLTNGSSEPVEITFAMRTFVEKTFSLPIADATIDAKGMMPIKVIAKLEDGRQLVIVDEAFKVTDLDLPGRSPGGPP